MCPEIQSAGKKDSLAKAVSVHTGASSWESENTVSSLCFIEIQFVSEDGIKWKSKWLKMFR